MTPQHAPTPREFGEALAQLRLARSVTIDEIAERTKIPRRTLEAFEKGDFADLPSRVFARMFLRQVLAVVKEPADSWMLSFDGAFDRFERSSQSFPTVAAQPPRRHRVWPWLIALALVAAGFVLLSVLDRAEKTRSAGSVPATPEALLRQTLPPPTEAPAPTVAPTAVPTPMPDLLVIRTGGRPCWVEVAVEDGTRANRLLEPSAVWEVDAGGRAVNLLLGDAGEVEVEYLGQRRAPVGAAGEVVRLRLAPSPEP